MTRYPLKRGTAAAVVLEYTDGQGERSVRQVMPLAIITDDPRQASDSSYLQARCSIAKAARTFRLDRINSICDARSGEVISGADWLTGLSLGAGQPFSWRDEDDQAPETRNEPERAAAAASRISARAIVILLVVGYMIGRFRLIELALRSFGVRHGVSL